MKRLFGIPLKQKLQGNHTKRILRELLERHLPASITRRPKQGFGTPIDLWMRRELQGLMDAALSPSVVAERGYFSPDYVTWLRQEQQAGRRDFSQHSWALLIFELWHRMYLDQDLSGKTDVTFADLGLSSEKIHATPSPDGSRCRSGRYAGRRGTHAP